MVDGVAEICVGDHLSDGLCHLVQALVGYSLHLQAYEVLEDLYAREQQDYWQAGSRF